MLPPSNSIYKNKFDKKLTYKTQHFKRSSADISFVNYGNLRIKGEKENFSPLKSRSILQTNTTLINQIELSKKKVSFKNQIKVIQVESYKEYNKFKENKDVDKIEVSKAKELEKGNKNDEKECLIF